MTDEEILTRVTDLCNEQRQRAPLHVAATILEALDWTHFGVETIEPPTPDPECNALAYINTGDTYHVTLCQEVHPDDGTANGYEQTTHGPIFISSWGSWWEGKEQEWCEKAEQHRCANCGSWTNVADGGPDATFCEQCGRNICTGRRAE